MSRILPILFNTDMVRAILDERKTATRRLIKGKIILNPQQEHTVCYIPEKPRKEKGQEIKCTKYFTLESFAKYEAHYQPGDILYVRETVWQKVGHYLDVDGETKPSWYKEFKYVATDDKPEVGWNYSWAKRPSIHMPKEAARIWLKVTDLQVERLQDISPLDVVAEGIRVPQDDEWDCEMSEDAMNLFEFEHVWDSTIKKPDLDRYAWEANPWVWVIEFERCEKPEREG